MERLAATDDVHPRRGRTSLLKLASSVWAARTTVSRLGPRCVNESARGMCSARFAMVMVQQKSMFSRTRRRSDATGVELGHEILKVSSARFGRHGVRLRHRERLRRL